MKFVHLTVPIGIATPPWPTCESLQVKYFKRLAPNGANGQILTHSNHVGTHLDGEIHFYTPGKDIRFVDGESSIGRCVAVVEDHEYEQLMEKKGRLPKTRFGDTIGCEP